MKKQELSKMFTSILKTSTIQKNGLKLANISISTRIDKTLHPIFILDLYLLWLPFLMATPSNYCSWRLKDWRRSSSMLELITINWWKNVTNKKRNFFNSDLQTKEPRKNLIWIWKNLRKLWIKKYQSVKVLLKMHKDKSQWLNNKTKE